MIDLVKNLDTLTLGAQIEETISRLKRYEDFVMWLEGFIKGVECSNDEEFFPISEIHDKLNDIREQEKQIKMSKSKVNEMIKQCRENEMQAKADNLEKTPRN